MKSALFFFILNATNQCSIIHGMNHALCQESKSKKQKISEDIPALCYLIEIPLDIQKLIVLRLASLPIIKYRPGAATENLQAIRQLRAANKHFHTFINQEDMMKVIISTTYNFYMNHASTTPIILNKNELVTEKIIAKQLVKPGAENASLKKWLEEKHSWRIDEETLNKAAFSGDLELVKKVLERVAPRPPIPYFGNKGTMFYALQRLSELEAPFLLRPVRFDDDDAIKWGKQVSNQRKIIELLMAHGTDSDVKLSTDIIFWTSKIPEKILQATDIRPYIPKLTEIRNKSIEEAENGLPCRFYLIPWHIHNVRL